MRVVSTENMTARRGPEEWFTGVVWMTQLPQTPLPAPESFACSSSPVRVPTGTHPEGQILYVVTGEGRAQREGEPLIGIVTGDVVYFAPGEKHWHGAGPDTFMVHMALNPANTTGGGTDWMEPVADEEYSADPS